MTKPIKIPEKMMFFLNEKARYKVAVGGRGSGKSINIGLSLIILSTQKKIRVLCTRQFQASIKDSVHKLLKDLIYEHGLENIFDITQDTIRCTLTGSEFIFKGLKNNIGEIKSIQGINYCWIEEAESVTEESWDILIPTIRETDSEIWVSFNPNMKTDATYQRFVVNKPENCITREINYCDNPFFPDVLREEMEACKALNYPKYEHIWLGVPNAEAGNLIKIAKFKRYNYPPESFDAMYITCDTAFSEKKSADNSAFLLTGIKGKDKYFLDLYCKKVTFVDLCRDLKSFYMKAQEQYGKNNTISAIYIENKASGISLTQQLRTEGLPILELFPTVHNEALKKDIVADKYTRFLEIEAQIDSGNVWIPESASWLPEFERQCEAFTGGKQDEHDDVCFVAGTMIKTKYGDKPIETLKVGDEVITPYGLRKVEAVKQTGLKKVIYNKELDLLGTPQHKVLTRTSGYSNLCDVNNIEECLKWNLKNLIIWKIKSLLYLMEENIAKWGGKRKYFLSYESRNSLRKNPKGLHVAVWEYVNNREVPKGYVIHHKDHNSYNNNPENLECISLREHLGLHKEDRQKYGKSEKCKKHLEEIRQLANEWHKSEEGREWHKKHAKEIMESKKETRVCADCGCEFEWHNTTRQKDKAFDGRWCAKCYRKHWFRLYRLLQRGKITRMELKDRWRSIFCK